MPSSTVVMRLIVNQKIAGSNPASAANPMNNPANDRATERDV